METDASEPDMTEKRELLQKEVPLLFEGRTVQSKASCCSKGFFSWVRPLINFANKDGQKLNLELYGDLPEKDQVHTQINNLRKEWECRRDGKGTNVLFRAVLSAYQSQYFVLMFFNILQTSCKLLSPFLIKFLIEYIQTGENEISAYVRFWDFSGTSFEWLTQEKQYGFSLALTLVFTQALSFIILENVSYQQRMIGVNSTNALIGLIYEKQL